MFTIFGRQPWRSTADLGTDFISFCHKERQHWWRKFNSIH